MVCTYWFHVKPWYTYVLIVTIISCFFTRQVSSKCSHPNHNIFDNSSVADQLVTMVMSVKMLQNAGQVVPISSKFCKNCYDDFNRMYGSKPGEKVWFFLQFTLIKFLNFELK